MERTSSGVCRRILQQMIVGFHGFVDWGTTRLIEWHMYLIDEMHLRSMEVRGMRLRSLWQRVVACAAADRDLVPRL